MDIYEELVRLHQTGLKCAVGSHAAALVTIGIGSVVTGVPVFEAESRPAVLSQ